MLRDGVHMRGQSSMSRAPLHRRVVLLSCIAVIVAAACSGAVITRGPDTSLVWLILVAPALLYAIWSFVQWSLGYLSSKDLFSPALAFPLAYVAWFSVGSLDIFDDGKELTHWYFFWGLASYVLGVRFFRTLSLSHCVPPNRFKSNWEPRRFWLCLIILLALMIGNYTYITLHIGIPVLSSDVAEKRFEVSRYGPFLAVFLSCAWTTFTFLAVRFRDANHKSFERCVLAVGMVVVACCLLSIGNRGFFLIPALTVVVAIHYVHRPFKFGGLARVAVGFFAATSIFGYLRDTITNAGSVSVEWQGSLADSLYPLYYAYEYVRGTVTTFSDLTRMIPRTVPYQRGTLTFGALVQVLPGHHESSDLFFERVFGGTFGGGQPATLLGPLYGDFGLVGITIGMFCFGCLMRRTYTWMKNGPTVFRAVIYAWLMQTAILGLFGSLLTYVITLFVPLLWMLLNFGMKSWTEESATT